MAIVEFYDLIGRHAVIWPRTGAWLKGRPARLIDNGVVGLRALRRHAIGHGDLVQALRRAGQDGPDRVRAADLERSGEISVILDPALAGRDIA